MFAVDTKTLGKQVTMMELCKAKKEDNFGAGFRMQQTGSAIFTRAFSASES